MSGAHAFDDERETRGNPVYRGLADRIWAGELTSSARLREEHMASSKGVSCAPVRKAFARPQERGLLQLEATTGNVREKRDEHEQAR